jgi:hypothetical protein
MQKRVEEEKKEEDNCIFSWTHNDGYPEEVVKTWEEEDWEDHGISFYFIFSTPPTPFLIPPFPLPHILIFFRLGWCTSPSCQSV